MQQTSFNETDEYAVVFAQKLVDKPKRMYTMKNDVYPIASSDRTARRYLNTLERLGIAMRKHGKFVLNNVLSSQRIPLVKRLVPSLLALKNGKRFGRHYDESDINFAMKNIHGVITLDYKVWELTKFQYPSNLYMYSNNFNETVSYLKDNGFSEGRKGRVVILPNYGEFQNETERVYLDCIAKGGRSIQDAIAIELLYQDHLTIKANFSVEAITKVQEDLPRTR